MSYFSSAVYAACLFLTCFGFQVEAVTSAQVFAKYQNKYFVETGSYYGDGIQMALNTGFQEIYSIELSPHYYELCKNRFSNNPHIHLVLGNSSSSLKLVLQNINSPATFWLDGHYSGGDTAKGDSNTPILAELKAIENHPIKTHTILIDDIRQLGTNDFDFVTLADIVKQIKKINPNYKISFEDGYVANDVLVAKVPENP